MKVITYNNYPITNEPLTIILKNEGYNVVTANSEQELKRTIKSNSLSKSIVLFHVNNFNFYNCYQSLKGVINAKFIRIKSFQVIVIAEQTIENASLTRLSTLTENVMVRPLDIEMILKKINSYKDDMAMVTPNNDNNHNISELLFTMKHQLYSIKNALINEVYLKPTNKKVISKLQLQLAALDKYLNQYQINNKTSDICVKQLILKAFATHNWNELNYKSSVTNCNISVNLEYFCRAIEDIVEKIKNIALRSENLSIREVIYQNYLIINFSIMNLELDKPQHLLTYPNFDFCHKVISLHSGDFFIKFEHNLAYITFRLPIINI